ncbi:MAG: hypothetical protein ACD_76C00078G0003 [uncultured bacterium]|nr:MAG: hypothetical protein ACD_76C00078G0003 [uncultured bacterium]HBD05027.1 hypothetical protein [Candidatus Uhrbacteria bacterium]
MKEIIDGFSYLFKGARHIALRRATWKHIWIPIALNALVFVLVSIAIVSVAMFLFQASAPDAFLLKILYGIIAAFAVVLSLFLYIMFFTAIGLVLGSPFYEALAGTVEREFGGFAPSGNAFRRMLRSVSSQLQKLFLFALAQIAFLAILLLPGIGVIAYTVASFALTVFLLGYDFVDFAFEARGWKPSKRRAWAIVNARALTGFGTAIFIFLLVPFVNMLVFPSAVVGAVLLFNNHDV